MSDELNPLRQGEPVADELDVEDIESISGGVQGTSGIIRSGGISRPPPTPPPL